MKHIFYLFIIATSFLACHTNKKMQQNNTTTTYAIRLKPGQDVRNEIETFVKTNNIEAGWVATCVGSLTKYNIRFANQQNGSTGTGHFEIVSLVGTLSINGCHIHINISDSTGRSIGGHLLQGCITYTTAEIVIQSTSNLMFKREKDGTTPWEELQIWEKNKP